MALYFEIDGETWEPNHYEKKIKYRKGKLTAREQDTFSVFNELVYRYSSTSSWSASTRA